MANSGPKSCAVPDRSDHQRHRLGFLPPRLQDRPGDDRGRDEQHVWQLHDVHRGIYQGAPFTLIRISQSILQYINSGERQEGVAGVGGRLLRHPLRPDRHGTDDGLGPQVAAVPDARLHRQLLHLRAVRRRRRRQHHQDEVRHREEKKCRDEGLARERFQ